MATQTPTKTDSVDVLSHQAATHPVTIVGSAQNCATKRAVTLHLYHGYTEATADTNPGKFLIQTSPDDGAGSVTENWVTVWEQPAKGTTPDSEAVSGTEAAGQTVISIASSTGFAVEDEVYFSNGTFADGEWGKVITVTTNTSLTLMDAITNAQTGATIFNDASKWVVTLDLNSVERYRVVWMHVGATGANGAVKVIGVTHDSDTST